MQNKLNQLKAATDSAITLRGNLATDYTSARKAEAEDRIGAKQDRTNGNLTLYTQELMI
jgi:hypothetical protein